MQKGRQFLSDLKLYSDYLKWDESKGRYENWDEACEAVIDTHRVKYKNKENELKPYLEEALTAYKNKEILASQRNLQFRGDQIFKHNARIYNCSVMFMDKPENFVKGFYILLCGTGLGVSFMKEHLASLPMLASRNEEEVKNFIVEDSIEGWARAAEALISSYCFGDAPNPEFQGHKIRFDYTQVRPKGAFITGGFKAPGPDGLKQSLERIETLLHTETVNQSPVEWRSVVAYDVFMHLADAVLSGGVRRSAMSIIVDPTDTELINAKVGNWRDAHPWRARSNNSVGLIRNEFTYDEFKNLLDMNEGASDIGFVFLNNIYEILNPCFEIGFTPILDGRSGISFCNLNEIHGGKCKTKEDFFKACRAAAILGTLQAGYTDFPFLGEDTEKIVREESLLGISITGMMTSMWLFDPEILEQGAEIVKATNEEVAAIIGINPAARATCIKPSGNSSVILGTSSGIHPEHSSRYFRIMQLNKDSETAKWLQDNMPHVLEDSVWSATNSDYAVFCPVENGKGTMYKDEMTGIKHLELIRMVQKHWVGTGKTESRGIMKDTSHNVSCTVIIDDRDEIAEYLFENQNEFTAVSFLSAFGDKDFNQAPNTSVLDTHELVEKYGDGVLFASGLITDGLHVFDENLWEACEFISNRDKKLEGTRTAVLLKKDWLRRARKFAKNYFKGNQTEMVYCLKDVHLWHKWCSLTKGFKVPDFEEILKKPEFNDIANYASVSCAGGACEIVTLN